MKSNPNPFFYPVLPYESLSSCVSINKKIKEKKMKRNINIDLAILPSHDSDARQEGKGEMGKQ